MARSASVKTSQYILFETSFGRCGVAWSDVGLTSVQLPEFDDAATERRLQSGGAESGGRPAAPATHAIDLLRRYFDGAPTDFTGVALDTSGLAAFRAAVYRALRDVGFGATTSYGALAQLAGAPGAARAVGSAMARNRWPVIVPCHRVLSATRRIGGYSAYGGEVTKRRLLQLEGVALADEAPALPL
jgi:methylated-DNA-[protein]-cysteine S-methyltransferase